MVEEEEDALLVPAARVNLRHLAVVDQLRAQLRQISTLTTTNALIVDMPPPNQYASSFDVTSRVVVTSHCRVYTRIRSAHLPVLDLVLPLCDLFNALKLPFAFVDQHSDASHSFKGLFQLAVSIRKEVS